MRDPNTFCFTSHGHDNWFFRKYYCSGSNSRYPTFQLALNLLAALGRPPLIVETGCQRQEDDLGAGMSTSIWGEFCAQFGGMVYTVELSQANLDVCRKCTKAWAGYIKYIQSDSVAFLMNAIGIRANLLYLDSMDYDYGGLLNCYGGRENIQAAIKTVDSFSPQEILARHSDIILPAQEHCLRELKAAMLSDVAGDDTLIMIDDNQLPGGGKSRLAKQHLVGLGWTCLLDFQQSVWMGPPRL